ncbi:MAG TPA: polymer-forming cytoskeletal protein [Methylophilaceae bacterium]|nr:polymer-forming cytoskeletal protein [Methylophilaceae bacterium]
MFFKSKNKPQSRIDTLIGAETRVEGDIHFKGGLRVDGNVRGNVSENSGTSGTLVLSEQGRIEGAITVSQAVINGKIMGPVRVNEYVELQSKSRVIGDVYYQSLEMHTGAVIDGKLIYLGDTAEKVSVDPLSMSKIGEED